MKVATANTARGDSDEFAWSFRNFLLDDGDSSLGSSDGKHAYTVVVSDCYVVVGAGTLVVVDVEVVLDVVDEDEVVVVLDELDDRSIVVVVVVVAEIICCANSVIFVMKYVVRVLYPVTVK